jgi:hypothetical protein
MKKDKSGSSFIPHPSGGSDMPGPVSDSYDCEWGTAANGARIAEALDGVYAKVSALVGNPVPLFILDLIEAQGMGKPRAGTLTVKEWRLIRFALERARESL